MRADVDLHENVERRHCRSHGGPQRSNVGRIVDQHAKASLACQRRETNELARAHDLVGHQHVVDAGGNEDFRLAHLLAADADGARCNLQLGDLGALVALGMRPQADIARIERGFHHR